MAKTEWFVRTAWVVLIFLAASCTANLEVRKNQEEASRNLGEEYMKIGDFTAALKEFLEAEKLYDQDPILQTYLGITYMAKEKVDLAIVHFKKALAVKPDYAPARNNLGFAFLATKDWDAAIDCFKKLSEDLLNPTPHYPLLNLGWAYYNKKDYRLAEKYYLEALKSAPGFVVAQVGLGRTYLAMGRVREALELLEKAAKNSPRFPDVYFELGKGYQLSGEHTKAVTAYGKVVELAPDSPLAREAKKEAENIKR
ncbi:MAG: tetratricopeptide repeat protein [Candidatus Omnitrophota bacterium]